MPLRRDLLAGPPHSYYVQGHCAGDLAPLDEDESRYFLALLERIRRVFDLRLYAYLILPDGYRLVFRHAERVVDSTEHLRERWRLLGGRSAPREDRLRRRLTSLSGVMQTLTQRFSMEHHRRRGGQGHLWAGRYRACLLADDTALLAVVSWLERVAAATQPAERSSGSRRRGGDASPALAPLPLRATPGDEVVPADDSTMALPPPTAEKECELLDRFAGTLNAENLASYGAAVDKAWTIGRPESLAEALARLGRQSGRGRSRRLRELDDELGLCGVWG